MSTAAREQPVVLMHRRGHQLVPHGPMDEAALDAFEPGKPLRVRITQPRNVGRHRLYWAMLTLIRENLDQPISVETLHEAVKVMLGRTVTLKTRQGDVVIPGSIAFDAMDESEFRLFLEDFKTLVRTRIIPGISRDAFEQAALEMMGDVSLTKDHALPEGRVGA